MAISNDDEWQLKLSTYAVESKDMETADPLK